MTSLALQSSRERTSLHSAAASASDTVLLGREGFAPSAPPRTGTLTTYDQAKRIVDVCVSALVLIALAPVMLVIACAVRLDSRGPVLFCQMRTGRYGRRFVLHKFRTMRDPDGFLLLGDCQLAGPVPKSPADPRVTRVGRFLRTWSLDELPNLWSVLRGDMSLVGPRPTSWDTDSYEPWQLGRLDVLPGVVGLPEVMGRSTLDFDTKARLDLEYVRHRSPGLDTRILVRAVHAVVSRVGAY
jgi:lipopolysaccharide/colanic/teichoic acid biosynthesis glycosyltransferase